MNSVSLPEAWAVWARGEETKDLFLWSMQIIWWGRIGKVIQFFAAFVLLFEVIGEEKFRKFGNSLYEHEKTKLAKLFLDEKWKWVLWRRNPRIFKDIPVGSEEWELLDNQMNYMGPNVFWWLEKEADPLSIATRVDWVVGWILTIVLLCPILIFVKSFIFFLFLSLLLAAPLWFFIGKTVSPLLTLLLLNPINMIGFGIDFFMIKPIAKALDNPRLEKFVKILSLLMIIIGFHFDLLAS